MAIWRLINHHHKPQNMLTIYRQQSCISMGWGSVGDLNQIRPNDPTTIQQLILNNQAYAILRGSLGASAGGRCLWGFYHEMKPDDLVILSNGNGPLNDVVQVKYPYQWVSPPVDGDDYNHYRSVIWRNDLNGVVLWNQYFRRHSFTPPWNVRWALYRLQ